MKGVHYSRVVLCAILCFAFRANAQERPSGTWSGAISVMGTQIGIKVHFADDAASTTIDIQGAFGLALQNVQLDDGMVHFELPAGPGLAVFDGSRTGDTIGGSFTQAGQTGTFSLAPDRTDVEAPAQPERLGQSVSVPVPGGALHGSLLVPESAAPVPVVVLVAGSGPTDRDGNSSMLGGKNNSLLLLATALAENGIASLRYDKRGVGESGGAAIAEVDLRFDHFVDDLVAWIDWLRDDERIGKIVVAGHSEGSLVGLVAAERTTIDGFVSIAGPGRSAPVVLREQLGRQLTPALMNRSEAIIAAVGRGEVVDDVPPELNALFRRSVQPYLTSWFAHEPAKQIAALEAPALIVQGTTDIQIAVADAQRLHEAKPSSELAIVKGMNHVLKDVGANQAEQLASYSDPDLPINGEIVERIVRFVGEL